MQTENCDQFWPYMWQSLAGSEHPNWLRSRARCIQVGAEMSGRPIGAPKGVAQWRVRQVEIILFITDYKEFSGRTGK